MKTNSFECKLSTDTNWLQMIDIWKLGVGQQSTNGGKRQDFCCFIQFLFMAATMYDVKSKN